MAVISRHCFLLFVCVLFSQIEPISADSISARSAFAGNFIRDNSLLYKFTSVLHSRTPTPLAQFGSSSTTFPSTDTSSFGSGSGSGTSSSNNSPTLPEAKFTSQQTNLLALGVGLGIGIPALLIVLSLLGWWFIVRRHKRKEEERRKQQNYGNEEAVSMNNIYRQRDVGKSELDSANVRFAPVKSQPVGAEVDGHAVERQELLAERERVEIGESNVEVRYELGGGR